MYAAGKVILLKTKPYAHFLPREREEFATLLESTLPLPWAHHSPLPFFIIPAGSAAKLNCYKIHYTKQSDHAV